eukprot:TRINITY_DN10848_c1_g1_i7.p1 TRINITY_DN10848_c1_g1~~TRINITY_DN10848_c1_g1_i7.p1  ORF type:complete len:104 (+),score=10.69 TRINITY_DN10848_c1_g1_i7:285-596(+)
MSFPTYNSDSACDNGMFNSACVASVSNNPNLIGSSNVNVNNDTEPCQVGTCKKHQKVLVPVLASVIPALVLLIIAVLLYFKNFHRGEDKEVKFLFSLFSRFFH